eukprot:TRINITY_DN108649_c0_g1_i1.p2 TRINITY_DN108649_c0_g1~~TRINITY_DN108649_c0_g1_i1.p2  ORF type:complete len:129 (-),score=4.76 TRINITY_DN108649_c0_g1_i1:112-498(-)
MHVYVIIRNACTCRNYTQNLFFRFYFYDQQLSTKNQFVAPINSRDQQSQKLSSTKIIYQQQNSKKLIAKISVVPREKQQYCNKKLIYAKISVLRGINPSTIPPIPQPRKTEKIYNYFALFYFIFFLSF